MKNSEPTKEDAVLPDHLVDYNGNKCPIDPNNPLVLIESKHSENYERGDIVYPIAKKGEQPGDHPMEECITVSTINTDRAGFLGAEKGQAIIPLAELIEKTGSKVGVTLDGENRAKMLMEISKRRELIGLMVTELITQRVPKDVRERPTLSAVKEAKTIGFESGIICNSLDEVGNMLRSYEQGVAPKGNVTQDKLLDDVGKSCGGLGVALVMLENANGSQFVEDMIAQIRARNGNWEHSYDYDGKGSFFKTSVRVTPKQGKFILNIDAAYVGNEPERQLAEAMGAERVLIGKGGKYNLSPIKNTDWVGVNFNKIFKDILPKDQIVRLAMISAGEKEETNVVQIDGVPVKLRVSLGQENNYFSKVIRIGNRLFFQTKEKGSEGKYGSEHGDAYFSFSVGLGNGELGVDSASKEKLEKVQQTLDKIIQEKLSNQSAKKAGPRKTKKG